MVVMVHGDDFISTGGRSAMVNFRKMLESRFEIKTTVVELGENEVNEARVLNRIIRISNDGWEYEPDQRHAEMVINALGLEEANEVSTPGEEDKK